MVKATLTGFLIGLVLISGFAAIFALFITELGTEYGANTTGLNLSKYDHLNELHQQSKSVKGNVSDIDQPSGILDIVGGFFYNAYKVLRGIPESFEMVEDMTEQGIVDADLGTGGGILKSMLLTMLMIVLFVGVILAILLKRDEL